MAEELNDLGELNEILFDTLRKVKSGSIKAEDAKSVMGLGSVIINNAKVQLTAYSMTKGKTGVAALGVSSGTSLQLPEGEGISRYDMAQKLAKAKEYKNVPDAIADIGKDKFNKELDKYILDGELV